MNPFNPLKRAETVRNKMMDNGKYLIAKIQDSGQEPQKKKIIDAYFRYKDYMKNTEWFSADLDEVWSPKYIGLTKNASDSKKIKKLEFQNPSYSAAYRLGGDPRDYSKVFTIQLAGCDYDCNYCYVPKELNVANRKKGMYFSAEEIIDHFLAAREKSQKPMNVVRISGGNPTLVPQIISDIFNQITKRKLNVYLWIDTNLSTPKYMQNISDFRDILSQKNVGVVGCFKGTCKEDFSMITGADAQYYEMQYETAKWLLDQKTDFYVYLPALVYENNIEEKLRLFIEKLIKLNKNLPLRTEILEIKDYPGALLNEKRAEKLGRYLPKTNQRTIFELWNKVLGEFYSLDYLNKYCCQFPLYSSD